MITIIDQWYGRLANNIIQVVNALHVMKTYGYSELCFPPHPYITPKSALKLYGLNNGQDKGSELTLPSIVIDEEGLLDIEKSTNQESTNYLLDSFFDAAKIKEKFGIDRPEPIAMKTLFIKYINPVLTKFSFQLVDILENEQTLMIHIRGGDVFKGNGAHKSYVQPPLAYYKKIIDSRDWYAILVAYENDKNPCVDALQEHYSERQNILFQSEDLIIDINTLTTAKNLCVGAGTFGLMLYLMSPNITDLYIPQYALDELPAGNWGIEVHSEDLPNYIPMGTWENKPEQRQLMLDYKL